MPTDRPHANGRPPDAHATMDDLWARLRVLKTLANHVEGRARRSDNPLHDDLDTLLCGVHAFYRDFESGTNRIADELMELEQRNGREITREEVRAGVEKFLAGIGAPREDWTQLLDAALEATLSSAALGMEGWTPELREESARRDLHNLAEHVFQVVPRLAMQIPTPYGDQKE